MSDPSHKHRASKIKGRLGRLHRSSTKPDTDSDEAPRVFTADGVSADAPLIESTPVPSTTFTRAEDPEDDFIVTTHPFVPTKDRTHHGLAPIASGTPWTTPERVAGLERVVERDKIAFLDIETSGLRNTDAILCIAVGYWLSHHPADMFHVKHYFIFHPHAEANMLRVFLRDLSAFDVMCTYNGKSFDAPRIKSRCTQMGIDPEAVSRLRHVDLVHTSRRLLQKRNHKLNLASMERTLLSFGREHDLPGSEVPRRWHQFIMSQDLALLDEIRDHNLLDVVSLAALLEIFARGGPKGQGEPKGPQQTLPMMSSAPPAPVESVAPSPVSPPRQAQAMSPMQRKLARSYELKSKSTSTPEPARHKPAPPKPAAVPVESVEPMEAVEPVEPVQVTGSEPDAIPGGMHVGGRVSQLRAQISASLKSGESIGESAPRIMELVAIAPQHTQGLRWLIAYYESMGARELVITLRARLDAQSPFP